MIVGKVEDLKGYIRNAAAVTWQAIAELPGFLWENKYWILFEGFIAAVIWALLFLY